MTIPGFRKWFAAALSLVFAASLWSCNSSDTPVGGSIPDNLSGGSIQGTPLTLAGTVSGFAGQTPREVRDGIGRGATYGGDGVGLATDNVNLYLLDSATYSIRKLNLASRAMTTLNGGAGYAIDGAGPTAGFYFPRDIALSGTDLYIAEYQRIRRLSLTTGILTTLLPDGSWGAAGGTVPALTAFYSNKSIAADGTNLYVVDNNLIVRIALATGAVTTLAGSQGAAGFADGTGDAARFNRPRSIETDGTNCYVADTGNRTIRKIAIATGEVTTLAGDPAALPESVDGTEGAAHFASPQGITIDGANLYVSDNGLCRKVVIDTGTVTTLAGTTGPDLANDGTTLYSTDNYTVTGRNIATGAVATLAGKPGVYEVYGGFYPASTDGTGNSAQFYSPLDVTTDGTFLYVAEARSVRKVSIATREVTTLATFPSTVEGGSSVPAGITNDGRNLYLVDINQNVIHKVVIATGQVSTLAGGIRGYRDGVGSAARFDMPQGITTDGTSLYVSDSGNNLIRKVSIATGEVTTLAGDFYGVGGDGIGTEASFGAPRGIVHVGGNLFVADSFTRAIRKVVVATGEVTTLAGTLGAQGLADGTGAAARFHTPSAITSDGTNLYVTDYVTESGGMLRKIAIATGEVSTLGGPPEVQPTTVSFTIVGSGGLTTDGRRLYVVDGATNAIRTVE